MALHGGLSFCKTQQVVGFDCAGIERGSLFRNLTLVSYWASLSAYIVFLQRSLRL